MKRLWIYVLAALALVSCVREWSPEPTPAEKGLVERTWTVAMSDDFTRATLDEHMTPVWEVGERLSVYDPVIGTGRVFTVTAVEGNQATISGQISEGDFPFDAIYPSKSAGAWNSDGTNSVKFPQTQSIPAGRNICPDMLVSTAHSEDPDGAITFHNAVSLLKVGIGRDDIWAVTLTLAGESGADAASYQIAAAEGCFTPGTYYVAVAAGSYAGGVSVSCSDLFGNVYEKCSSTPLQASLGGILNLGTVSDGTVRRYYKVFGEGAYASQGALLDETGLLSGLDALTSLVVNLLLSSYFPDRNNPVRTFNYSYMSVDPQGNPTELSARVYLPEAALTGGAALSGIAIANHGTIASLAECPTMSADFEAAFAWKNYAIVMPDYYGFGVSKACPQAYLDPETTARGNIDAYLSAVQLLQDRDVAVPATLFNFGYSQGGFNAMANLRYVSRHPELGIRFRRTFCGGSPFDVPKTWESYLAEPLANAAGFVPLTLVSFNEAQQLGIDYSHLFKEPLLSHVQDWILSKQYSLAKIKANIGFSNLSDILTADLMAGTGADFNAILETCRRFSLTSGWAAPADGSWIYIYHSTQDDSVPYANYTAMREYLLSVAPDADIVWQSGANGDHVDGCIAFLRNILSNDYWKP